MNKINFSDGWFCRQLDSSEIEKPVTIPHDAMLGEKRTRESLGGKNIGWFEGHDYEYRKEFFVPKEWKEKVFSLEFEGVYHHAEVWINGVKVLFRPYGYTNFYLPLNEYVKYDTNNEIKVIARNQEQPNSRWYTGTGIYRPVYLYVGNKKHIQINGVKIKTLEIKPVTIEVEIKTTGTGKLFIEILQDNQVIGMNECEVKEEKTNIILALTKAKLWSVDHPKLCECRVTFEEEMLVESFGIRKISWGENGLLINNQRVILRGACIHHDNGVLGACAYPDAEARKVRLLKENGYNAIRSAHNPCSKALLDACDRLGMFVMDEYLDVWYIHKTKYDYANYMEDWWQEDLKEMVEKDYNHPSVILYSTGNEVAETAQKRGIDLTKQMTEYLHTLDVTRPVTCGINIFFNFLSSAGLGVYSDDKAEKEVKNAGKKKKSVGSEFYNDLAGLLGAHTMKIGATLYPCDLKTRDAYANMDIAGYNYGILRYKKDLKKYKNRLILGTETFCADAYKFWEMAKINKRIIGDFVWAGMDYIGEAGIGAWEYEEYAPKNIKEEGWLTAGSGRLNIIGRASGEAAYTKVAFEQEEGPSIATRPIFASKEHSPSAWKMTDALRTWTYTGCEGREVEVEIYARAYLVELYINNNLKAKKRLKNTCRAVVKTIYEKGQIRVVSKDINGKIIGEDVINTASDYTKFSLSVEEKLLKENCLAHVWIQYTDENGILKPLHRGNISVSVEGGKLLGLGNGCAYNPDGYQKNTTFTYYGEALAVIQAGNTAEVVVNVTDGICTASHIILVDKK